MALLAYSSRGDQSQCKGVEVLKDRKKGDVLETVNTASVDLLWGGFLTVVQYCQYMLKFCPFPLSYDASGNMAQTAAVIQVVLGHEELLHFKAWRQYDNNS